MGERVAEVCLDRKELDGPPEWPEVELRRRGVTSRCYASDARGRSSMVELQPSKLVVRVRFPSPAPQVTGGFRWSGLVLATLRLTRPYPSFRMVSRPSARPGCGLARKARQCSGMYPPPAASSRRGVVVLAPSVDANRVRAAGLIPSSEAGVGPAYQLRPKRWGGALPERHRGDPGGWRP